MNSPSEPMGSGRAQSELPQLDAALLAEYRAYLQPDELAALFARHHHTLEQEAMRLQTACTDGDLDTITHSAHKLAGSAAVAGFLVLTHHAHRLEAAARAGDAGAVRELMECFPALHAASRHALNMLANPLHDKA